MKLAQLRRMALFALVAKEGSFTAVGHQQALATSVVSTAISQLEVDLGVLLFHRSTRKLSLTAEGIVFLKRCQAMLWEAECAYEEIHQLTGQLSGLLTMTASLFESKYWLLPAISSLLEENPKLVLNLVISDRTLDMVSQGIDIALRVGELMDSTLVARPLCDVPEVIVASQSYLARYGVPQSPKELSNHRIIAFVSFDQPQHLSVRDQQGQLFTIQLELAAKTNSVELMIDLALMGQGIARLPREMINLELQNQHLVELLPNYSLDKIRAYAVTLKRDLQPPKVVAALSALQQFMMKRSS